MTPDRSIATFGAQFAEVEVNRTSGAIRVTRLYISHDCGQVINPDGLKNQIVLDAVERSHASGGWVTV